MRVKRRLCHDERLFNVTRVKPQPDQADHDTGSSRRRFVTQAAKRAAYVAPVVMVLTAARQVAADYTGCTGPGSPCTMHNECCRLAAMACMTGGMVCMGGPDCVCDP